MILPVTQMRYEEAKASGESRGAWLLSQKRGGVLVKKDENANKACGKGRNMLSLERRRQVQ